MEEIKKQVEKEHYSFTNYLQKPRWNSYYHQIKETLECSPETVLIIGEGDGIVLEILKKYITKVETFDIAEDLKPDYLGNILELSNIVEEKKDCILCCQVLEHLPFEYFEKALLEIKKRAKNKVIISLPYRNFSIFCKFKLPKLKVISIEVVIPRFYEKWKFNGEHYWEIGTKGYSLKKIRETIEKYFKITDEYYVEENKYHRFFILEKKDNDEE